MDLAQEVGVRGSDIKSLRNRHCLCERVSKALPLQNNNSPILMGKLTAKHHVVRLRHGVFDGRAWAPTFTILEGRCRRQRFASVVRRHRAAETSPSHDLEVRSTESEQRGVAAEEKTLVFRTKLRLRRVRSGSTESRCRSLGIDEEN